MAKRLDVAQPQESSSSLSNDTLGCYEDQSSLRTDATSAAIEFIVFFIEENNIKRSPYW